MKSIDVGPNRVTWMEGSWGVVHVPRSCRYLGRLPGRIAGCSAINDNYFACLDEGRVRIYRAAPLAEIIIPYADFLSGIATGSSIISVRYSDPSLPRPYLATNGPKQPQVVCWVADVTGETQPTIVGTAANRLFVCAGSTLSRFDFAGRSKGSTSLSSPCVYGTSVLGVLHGKFVLLSNRLSLRGAGGIPGTATDCMADQTTAYVVAQCAENYTAYRLGDTPVALFTRNVPITCLRCVGHVALFGAGSRHIMVREREAWEFQGDAQTPFHRQFEPTTFALVDSSLLLIDKSLRLFSCPFLSRTPQRLPIARVEKVTQLAPGIILWSAEERSGIVGTDVTFDCALPGCGTADSAHVALSTNRKVHLYHRDGRHIKTWGLPDPVTSLAFIDSALAATIESAKEVWILPRPTQ